MGYLLSWRWWLGILSCAIVGSLIGESIVRVCVNGL